MTSFLQDLRFAARTLVKNPGLTAALVLTLTLGVGANTAIFSMVDGLLLRPLAVRDPDRMVFLGFPQRSDNLDIQFSLAEMQEIEEQSRTVLSNVAGMAFGGVEGGHSGQDGLTVDGQTQPLQTLFVAGDFFGTLGIAPQAGRLLLRSEGTSAPGDPVVVISHRYWERRFASDPSIVGRQAAINGRPVTIVGIAPRGFLGVTPIVETQGYVPVSMLGSLTGAIPEGPTTPEPRLLTIVARLGPGLSPEEAQSALDVVGQRIFREHPRRNARGALRVRPLRPPGIITGENPLPRLASLFLLLAALVLLLACVNAANLLLVRAASRQREMAIRAALGANRGRLIRQLFTETLLIALLGGLGGTLMGLVGSDVIGAIPIQSDTPFALDLRFDWRVFAFALSLAVSAAFVVGLVPALRASRVNLSEALRAGGRTQSEGHSRVRSALVAVQIGGSLALLIVAGLFTRSLLTAQAADLGFDPRNVLNVTLDPHEIGYDQAQAMGFHRELLERARGLPGVESASLTRIIPLGDTSFSDGIEIPERPTPEGTAQPSALYNAVSPGSFTTLRIGFLRGRDFTDADGDRTARVAIINQAMAERFWPTQEPLGLQFRRASDPGAPVEIVGVVGNARLDSVHGALQPSFYVPLAQDYASLVTLQVRSRTRDAGIARSVEELVRSLAPSMPVVKTGTMTRAVHTGMNGLLLFEIGAGLAAALGGLGLTLAIVGIYGVMSYSVSLRTFELGIRIALGAQRTEILRLVGRQALAIVVTGIGIGLIAAWATTGLIGDFLVDVAPTDPSTYAGVSAILATVALVASYIPVRRAMRVDPTEALRHE